MRAAFATFIVIVAGLLAVAAASGQPVDPPQAPSVGFGAHVIARIPSYTRMAGDTALLFEDDPIGIEVSLANHSGDALRVSTPGRWWIDDLRLSMVALQKTGDSQPVAVSVTPVLDGEAPVLEIPAGLTTVELRIRPEHPVGPLPPGSYRLTVTLGGELASDARNMRAVTRELKLEIREAATLEARLDDYMQQAFFASRAQRYDEAAMWASRAVAAHPSSVIALADGANSWRFHGRCTEGLPMLRQAMGIMSRGGDPLLIHPLPASYRDALQAMATRCGRETRDRDASR